MCGNIFYKKLWKLLNCFVVAKKFIVIVFIVTAILGAIKTEQKYFRSFLWNLDSSLLKTKTPEILSSLCPFRYGSGSFEQYKENLHVFFREIKDIIPSDCLILWNMAMPLGKKIKGGFLVPEVSIFQLQTEHYTWIHSGADSSRKQENYINIWRAAEMRREKCWPQEECSCLLFFFLWVGWLFDVWLYEANSHERHVNAHKVLKIDLYLRFPLKALLCLCEIFYQAGKVT